MWSYNIRRIKFLCLLQERRCRAHYSLHKAKPSSKSANNSISEIHSQSFGLSQVAWITCLVAPLAAYTACLPGPNQFNFIAAVVSGGITWHCLGPQCNQGLFRNSSPATQCQVLDASHDPFMSLKPILSFIIKFGCHHEMHAGVWTHDGTALMPYWTTTIFKSYLYITLFSGQELSFKNPS